MEGATTLLSNSAHFSIASKDFLAPPFHTTHSVSTSSTRKRKPIVTYQSPASGVLDVDLLVRNTALEFEAAAVAAATRAVPVPVPVSVPVPPPPSAMVVDTEAPVPTPSSIPKPDSKADVTRSSLVYRRVTIPRPPRPLYHPLSRPSTSKATVKTSTTTSSSTSQLAPPAMETGRRSSSRTRRPAPKMRDGEGLMSISKVVPEKPSPVKRRRGAGAGAGAGKRKRAAAQLDVDGDGAYPHPGGKRARKAREKVEVEVDGETMPPPSTNETSPPTGYSTRAKRPRKATHTRAESSTSDGTGSMTRTTPVNGPVEEFWVPTKAT